MSKAEILGNIRRGLGGKITDEARATVKNRIQAHAPNLIPARGQLPAAERQELFINMARESAAELIELNDLADLPAALDQHMQSLGITELIMAQDKCLTSLDWSPLQNKQTTQRVSQVGDLASLTTAFLGIAETGTLMLYSRAESPTTLNFLPDTHYAVLRREDIVGVYEDAWNRLREETGGQMPRTVNLITGPSRSADIEQTLQMGAHGPRQLVIYLI
ncbi:LutC/YkgG family protein [Nitrincola sp. MINF-07-Sa-05]|uniref:LutC/YkgG family protein n=1 Tax=Nitrincola salilacus TaxID=3400273 RepID=UPI003917C5F0